MMPTKTAADDEELDVAVADVGQLMGEHGLELGVVERVHQPAGDGDRVLALADAAGEGVPLRRLDDAERRHGDAAADAEILEEVPEPRLASCGRLACAPVIASMMPRLANQAIAHQMSGDDEDDRDDAREERDRIADTLVDGVGVEARR